MNSRAALLQKFSHRRILAQRLEQFDMRFANRQHCHLDTLLGNLAREIYLQPHRVPPKREGFVELARGNTNVIDFHIVGAGLVPARSVDGVESGRDEPCPYHHSPISSSTAE